MRDDIMRSVVEVNGILDEYIKLHNDIFKFSIRKMVPIPGIFKKIDYEDNYKTLNILLTELNTAYYGIENTKILVRENPKELDFINVFIGYIQALSDSLSNLKEICEKFQEKINYGRNYGMGEYDSDVLKYQESTKKYKILGEQLNELFYSLK